jgi:hypothetical protein
MPYPPSWVDRLLGWVDRLPGPVWVFYLGAMVGVSLIRHAFRWIDGTIPAGSLDLSLATEAPFLVFTLVAQHYLNATARRALQEFRPALQLDESEYATLEYKLTHDPARAWLIAGLLAAVLGLLYLMSMPAAFGVSSRTSLVTYLLTASHTMLISALFFVFVYHILRQLRLVAAIHAMAKYINLFQLSPVYAFSSLTARTGLVMLLYINYNYLLYFYLIVPGTRPGPVEYLALGFMFLVALACFVLPLNGIHQRLMEEQSRLLAEANRRFELTISALHQQVDEGQYGGMLGLQNALGGLRAEREMIERISTWPWRPETLRGFLSAVGLPILLYLATRLLGRFLGL